MNNPYNIYNQNVPFIRHTDWASVAKQWATLRADVNIPQSIPELHNFHNIPPPPPPSPPMEHTLEFQSNAYDNYHSINDQLCNNQELININRNMQISPNIMNTYQPLQYSIFEEKRSSTVKSSCETFDYNHGNRPYEYYNNDEVCKPPVTTIAYTQNMWNLPPPDHPDIVRSNFKAETFPQQDPIPQPKLFPINYANDYITTVAVNSTPTFFLNKTTPITKSIEPKMYIESRFDTDFVAAKPNKGLPAWIIDDMKKMKDKERKQTYHSMDIYKDNPVNSRRDEEGDVVMEDVSREIHNDGIMSGKNVTKHPIDNSATEADISDVSPHDADPLMGKINYSSKSLMELIEMLDDSEVEALKISIIRDSLTDVMKEITDDMIFATVKSTFSRELTRGKKTHKHKGKSNAFDSSAKHQGTDVMSQLLGLDVYESDDEDNDTNRDMKLDSSSNKSANVSRAKWCTGNKQSVIKVESDIKLLKTKSSNDKSESYVKEKGNASSETSSKRKHRSKSRDNNGRSKDKKKSHKKSKKHSDISEQKEDTRKSDHREKSDSSRKK